MQLFKVNKIGGKLQDVVAVVTVTVAVQLRVANAKGVLTTSTGWWPWDMRQVPAAWMSAQHDTKSLRWKRDVRLLDSSESANEAATLRVEMTSSGAFEILPAERTSIA